MGRGFLRWPCLGSYKSGLPRSRLAPTPGNNKTHTIALTMTEHRQGHDYAAANKQYFDENVTVFERPDMVLLTRRLATATKEKYPNLFNVESTTVLDYACGAGACLLFI